MTVDSKSISLIFQKLDYPPKYSHAVIVLYRIRICNSFDDIYISLKQTSFNIKLNTKTEKILIVTHTGMTTRFWDLSEFGRVAL